MIPILLFVAAQGAVVWASAAVGLRLCGAAGRPARAAALAVSYVAWCAATLTAYALAGGGGGMMQGGALLLMALMTALASSAAYGAAWMLWPVGGRSRVASESAAQVAERGARVSRRR